MKKILFIAIALLLAGTAYFYYRHPIGQKVHIRNHVFTVDLAVTNAEKEKGLGGRSTLAPDAGMLFVYQTRGKYGYWMKGMQIPLDFIWIDGNIIVDLSRNVPAPKNPYETPVIVAPQKPVDKVFEVNAGVIDRLGIQIGDIAQFTD